MFLKSNLHIFINVHLSLNCNTLAASRSVIGSHWAAWVTVLLLPLQHQGLKIDATPRPEARLVTKHSTESRLFILVLSCRSHFIAKLMQLENRILKKKKKKWHPPEGSDDLDKTAKKSSSSPYMLMNIGSKSSMQAQDLVVECLQQCLKEDQLQRDGCKCGLWCFSCICDFSLHAGLLLF